jgi:hypothetical protein
MERALPAIVVAGRRCSRARRVRREPDLFGFRSSSRFDDARNRRRTSMKTLSVALGSAVMLAGSVSGALASLSTGDRLPAAAAQWSTVAPIRPNARGEPSCPANFVIRGKVCVSIFAGARAQYLGAGDRETAQPFINAHGQKQCPSNFVIRRRVCVSLYY